MLWVRGTRSSLPSTPRSASLSFFRDTERGIIRLFGSLIWSLCPHTHSHTEHAPQLQAERVLSCPTAWRVHLAAWLLCRERRLRRIHCETQTHTHTRKHTWFTSCHVWLWLTLQCVYFRAATNNYFCCRLMYRLYFWLVHSSHIYLFCFHHLFWTFVYTNLHKCSHLSFNVVLW